MPNIQKLDCGTKEIYGLEVRTKNVDELQSESQKIAPLWERFNTEVMPKLKEGALVYGVYSQYESDAMGAFNVLAGSDDVENTEGLVSVTLSEGRYLRFPVKGEMPQAIIETWEKVWAYFEDPSIDERRSFETDYEEYISESEAAIYIGVNYF